MQEKNYSDYIVYILGADNFDISIKLRNYGAVFGMDTAYNKAVAIAQKFELYDKQLPYISQYLNLTAFIEHYNEQLLDFIINDKDFIVEDLKIGEE